MPVGDPWTLQSTPHGVVDGKADSKEKPTPGASERSNLLSMIMQISRQGEVGAKIARENAQAQTSAMVALAESINRLALAIERLAG